jgi:hypothetical protein
LPRQNASKYEFHPHKVIDTEKPSRRHGTTQGCR